VHQRGEAAWHLPGAGFLLAAAPVVGATVVALAATARG
jgi:hypothetical protein